MAPFPSYTKEWHTSSYPSISPSRPELSLEGKTVVLTGGGVGIGFAIAKSVAKAGASRLAIIGRRAGVLAQAASAINATPGNKTEVLTVSADVANKAEVDNAFSQISTKFLGKSLDILIPNAGYFTGIRPLGTETEDELQSNFNVNVKAVYLITTAFIAKASPSATIVNVSTAVAHLFPIPGFSSYAATKLAGAKIMQYVQDENPSMHVVNMHPGQVRETDMARKVSKDTAGDVPEKDDGDDGDDHIDDAELAGDFAVWLASPEARFLKGKLVWVNWDVDEMKSKAEEIESTSILTLGLEGFSTFK